MIKKYSQQGSAHLAIILVLVVALLTTLGLIFWQNFNNKDSESTKDTTTTSDTSKSVDAVTENSSETPDVSASSNQGYVVVKEWSVKFRSEVSDKLEYNISSRVGLSTNTAYEELGLRIKSGALVDKSCTNPGADLYRQAEAPSDYSTKKIGDYYYFVTGAPGECSLDASDIKIQATILDDLVVANIEKL